MKASGKAARALGWGEGHVSSHHPDLFLPETPKESLQEHLNAMKCCCLSDCNKNFGNGKD